MRHGVLVSIIVVVLVGGFVVYQHYSSPSKEPVVSAPVAEDGAHVLTLTSDGYVPQNITITVGETVTFRSEMGEPFWPASNLHPSHTVYSDFDPRQPVQPNDSWSFTFTKVGEWEYHDHLAPYHTGVITVIE